MTSVSEPILVLPEAAGSTSSFPKLDGSLWQAASSKAPAIESERACRRRGRMEMARASIAPFRDSNRTTRATARRILIRSYHIRCGGISPPSECRNPADLLAPPQAPPLDRRLSRRQAFAPPAVPRQPSGPADGLRIFPDSPFAGPFVVNS